jgi:hypothetical protein
MAIIPLFPDGDIDICYKGIGLYTSFGFVIKSFG